MWKIKEVGKHPTFYGAIDANEAESLLMKQNKTCCHLMRYSEARDEYMLSVLRNKEDNKYLFHNFDIFIEYSDEQGCATYEVYGSDKYFSSISALLNFYKKNLLTYNIGSIGDGIGITKPMFRVGSGEYSYIENLGIY